MADGSKGTPSATGSQTRGGSTVQTNVPQVANPVQGGSTVQNNVPQVANPVQGGSTVQNNVPQVANPVQGGNDTDFRNATRTLRKALQLYFYNAFKISCATNRCNCWIHGLYFVCMIGVQLLKVIFLTALIYNFGKRRGSFNAIVTRGHDSLNNLLLKDWDAFWDTLPYPPAHGEFATYKVETVTAAINHSITQLYNIEDHAKGFFKRSAAYPVTAEITYFDFGGFVHGGHDGISVLTKSFDLTVRNHTNHTSGETVYTYDVDEDFKRNNISEPIKRLLSISFRFQLQSMRVINPPDIGLCLLINGQIIFSDPDNTGQVRSSIDTSTERQICADMGYKIKETEIGMPLQVAVLVLTSVSIIATVLRIVFGVFATVKTYRYMDRYFPRRMNYVEVYLRTRFPGKAYLKFVGVLFWDALVITADGLLIHGIRETLKEIDDGKWTVQSLDHCTLVLGAGGFVSWLTLLRYFNFHHKFNFSTPSSSIETLVSLVNGDEVFQTFALHRDDLVGDTWVTTTYKAYLYSYVAIFTVLALNLLIAIFTSYYEAVRRKYEEETNRMDASLVAALKDIILSDTDDPLKQALRSLLREENEVTTSRRQVKEKLLTTLHVNTAAPQIVPMQTQSLKEFIEDDSDEVLEDIGEGTEMCPTLPCGMINTHCVCTLLCCWLPRRLCTCCSGLLNVVV